MPTKTGYGIRVIGKEEPWFMMFPTYDAVELRKNYDRDYRPDQLEIVRMTWSWEIIEPTTETMNVIGSASP